MATSTENPVITAEVEGDTPWASLRIASAGHLPRKTQVVQWRAENWALGMVLAGAGNFQVEGKRFPVQAPCAFFLIPGFRYHYAPGPGGWEERYLLFEGDRVRDWDRWGWLPRELNVFPLIEHGALADQHATILDHLFSRERTQVEEAKLLAERLVFQLYLARVSETRVASLEDRLRELTSDWKRNPGAKVDFDGSARALGISHVHFRRLFRRQFGCPPYRFFAQIRIEYAVGLLRTTEMRMKEVAFAAGFSSLESFDRAFRKSQGRSPGQYRAEEGHHPM